MPEHTDRSAVEAHICDTGHFDRTVCPEPCGAMHSYCSTCGARADRCAHEASAQQGAAEALAVLIESDSTGHVAAREEYDESCGSCVAARREAVAAAEKVLAAGWLSPEQVAEHIRKAVDETLAEVETAIRANGKFVALALVREARTRGGDDRG